MSVAFSIHAEQGCTNFPYIWESPQNSRCQEGDMEAYSWNEDPQTLGANIQNIAIWAPWCPGFVHPCFKGKYFVSFFDMVLYEIFWVLIIFDVQSYIYLQFIQTHLYLDDFPLLKYIWQLNICTKLFVADWPSWRM